jgi:TolB-like protein
MKRTLVVAIVGLCLPGQLARAQPAAEEKKVVAVLPFSSPHRYSAMGRNAQSTFVTTLVQTQKLRVVQASMVARMLKRQGLHWTGTVDPQLLKAAGRWLKADFVLAGKLRWGGDTYILSAHVMNVQTLETTFAQDVDFRDYAMMRIAVRSLAKKIAGQVSGTGSSSSRSEMFLNINARAFYDTADAAIRAMAYVVNYYGFSGTVDSVDDSTKVVRVKGWPGRLKPGIALDIFSGNDAIDGPKRVTTAYFTNTVAGGFEAKCRFIPDDGIALGARISTANHRYVVAVGKIVDEVEDSHALVKGFRSALLQKMSEGTRFQEVEGGATDWLAKLSDRRTRFLAFRRLFEGGVEVVIEGKFYGSAGSRRAHFKIYSTLTGKLIGEPKFETRI